MAAQRDFQEIDILIPGYSIEDLPSDLNERSAASLLNAFSVAWHPWLLSAAKSLPEFRQAESTELPTGQHIVLVPECSEDWLGHEWQAHFSDTLSVVFHECSAREDWLTKISEQFGVDAAPIPDHLLNHFFALGTANLQVRLLSRRMHHFVDPDNYLLESETLAAAQAAIDGDVEKAHDHLRRSFECLQDCREQFYPVDCFLVDVCLPSDQTTAAELRVLIDESPALSLICSGADLAKYEQADAQFVSSVTTAVQEKRLALMTGHQHELRTSLGSLSSVYSDLDSLPDWVRSLAAESQLHWARRRFGMTSSLPALLSHFHFASALHVVLDDGLYPDREYGQLSWLAPDGSTIPSVSRIPMAIDGAASFLRFADRFTESMQEDTTAVMLLARLPTVQTPWLQDLKIAASYAPVLGRFATMTEYIDHTEGQATATKFDEGEYLSPFLIQSSVLKTEAPISSPAELTEHRSQVEAAGFLEAISAVLKPKQAAVSQLSDIERQLNDEEAQRISLAGEPDDPAHQHERLQEVGSKIAAHTSQVTQHLTGLIPATESAAQGVLVVNSLPWTRSISLPWPTELRPPAKADFITDAWLQGQTTHLAAELPAGGFLWLHEAEGRSTAVKIARPNRKPLAEHLLLRNKFFEVDLSESTGGIASVRFHNQRANRVSQQVNFRYESSKTLTIDDEEVVTPYASTRMVSSRIVAAGPFLGQVETTCEIVDVVTDKVLAVVRQTFTVERNSTRLQLQMVFDEVAQPPVGNPWMTYFASRFAWDNESASITRSMLGQASGFRMERFEAPDYVEVADLDQRLLILPHGRPYHRRSGRRMLDSLLIVEGESARRFEFTLDFDQLFPMRAALEVRQPPLQLPMEGHLPSKSTSAWILGLSARNVIAARTRVIAAPESGAQTAGGETDVSAVSLLLLLQETEGRSARCVIHTARTPRSARIRRADGTTIQALKVSDKGIVVVFSAFQLKEVELTF